MAMSKRMKTRPNTDGDAGADQEPELAGIALAARELSVALEDFDRQAASWSTRGDLVRT